MTIQNSEYGAWEVEQNGKMIYRKNNKIVYEIEPELLKDPNKILEILAFDDIKFDDFFRKVYKAAQIAKIDFLTIKID